MTQEQLLQSRAKVIQDYENEIIELKHLNDALLSRSDYYKDEVNKLRGSNENYIAYLKMSHYDRNKYINQAFVFGAIIGIIVTVVIISLL